jgi:hypothetical protein
MWCAVIGVYACQVVDPSISSAMPSTEGGLTEDRKLLVDPVQGDAGVR